eukprot:SRR837773.9281.p1 GENE.SRR837773.9281~~SRR837773.9281.p1  ORF type:complete len:295 (+),score=51.59 SRR837773.9281:99-887(+)
MAESEELVLSATAALTNLLFYDSPANILFMSSSKELLCRHLQPMLLEAHNVEALVEAARAVGNLSRHADARSFIGDSRIDEALTIFLAHRDRDLVFYSCGALVNLAADPIAGHRLCQQAALPEKVAAMLQATPREDLELLLVGVKVLSNLRLEGDSQACWPDETLRVVRAAAGHAQELALAVVASRAASELAASRSGSRQVNALGCSPAAEEVLADLAQRLLDVLPFTTSEQDDESGDVVEGHGMREDFGIVGEGAPVAIAA